jgi:hypothetical protein
MLQYSIQNKVVYEIVNYARMLIPKVFYRHKLHTILPYIQTHSNYNQIQQRVEYYCNIPIHSTLNDTAIELRELTYRKKLRTYFFDLVEFTRYFDETYRICYEFGDVTHIPQVPTIVKSRPIMQGNGNSVLFKLNKIRHFKWIQDDMPFQNKKDILIGRMSVYQPHRLQFYDMYFDSVFCDLGQVNTRKGNTRYIKPFMSIAKQLEYKYILCLEGNDVASNLKWVMSSNSIAVMPTPKFESWFMEGTLIPDYHYIHIADDYSNVEEKLHYYSEHPHKAIEIIQHAHEFVSQFMDIEVENLVAIQVLKTYFEKTNRK